MPRAKSQCSWLWMGLTCMFKWWPSVHAYIQSYNTTAFEYDLTQSIEEGDRLSVFGLVSYDKDQGHYQLVKPLSIFKDCQGESAASRHLDILYKKNVFDFAKNSALFVGSLLMLTASSYVAYKVFMSWRE